jgi:hypothetical protein
MASISASSPVAASQNNAVSNDLFSMSLRSGKKIKYNPALNKRYRKSPLQKTEVDTSASLQKRYLANLPRQLIGHVGKFLDAKSALSFTAVNTTLRGLQKTIFIGGDFPVTEILRKAKGKLSHIPPRLRQVIGDKEVTHSIRALDLHGIDMKEPALSELLALFTGLTELNLERCNLDNSSLKSLKVLSGVKKLNVSNNNKISDSGIEFLICHINVHELALRNLGLSNRSLEYISRTLHRLNDLDISNNNRITDDGIQYLSKFTNLERLNLAWCRQVNKFDILASITTLRTLTLGGIYLNEEETKPLVKLCQLAKLTLQDCSGLSARSVDLIGTLPNLRELDLEEIHLQDSVMIRLGELRNITKLNIIDCQVTYG